MFVVRDSSEFRPICGQGNLVIKKQPNSMMTRILYLIVWFPVLIIAQPNVPWDVYSNSCVPLVFVQSISETCTSQFLRYASRAGIGPIRPGCEIEGCCPGCQGEGSVDWSIHIQGSGEERFLLVFEGLTPEKRAALELDKTMRWLQNSDTLLIRAGRSVLKGFDRTYDDQDYPTARLYINADSSNYRGERFVFSIEQKIAAYTVQQFDVDIALMDCPDEPTTPSDEIFLSNNTYNNRSLVVVDGYRSLFSQSFYNDERYRLSRKKEVVNLSSPENEEEFWSDLFVLSRGDGMAMEKVNWTAARDVKIVNLPKMVRLPVTIWTMEEDFHKEAENDAIWANTHYDRNCTGIEFEYHINDLSDNMLAQDIIKPTCTNGGCSENVGLFWCNAAHESGFKNDNHYQSNAVNVYYVAGGLTGVTCAPNEIGFPDYNVIFIGATGSSPSTLAHELGHALGLLV